MDNTQQEVNGWFPPTSLRMALPSLVITMPPMGSINICMVRGGTESALMMSSVTRGHL